VPGPRNRSLVVGRGASRKLPRGHCWSASATASPDSAEGRTRAISARGGLKLPGSLRASAATTAPRMATYQKSGSARSGQQPRPHPPRKSLRHRGQVCEPFVGHILLDATGRHGGKFQLLAMVYQYAQVKLLICINSLEDLKPARFSDFAQVSPPASTDFARGRGHPWYVVPPRSAGWQGAGDPADLPRAVNWPQLPHSCRSPTPAYRSQSGGERSFPDATANGKVAPFPAVRGAAIEPLRSTPNPNFAAINGGGSPCPNCELRRLWRCNGAKW